MGNVTRNLTTQLTATSVNRRTLLRYSAIGLGVTAFMPLLAACEVDDDDDDVVDEPAVEPDDDDDDEVAEAEVDDDDDVLVDDDDEEDVPDDAEGVFGGTLTVALSGTLTSMDAQSAALANTRQVAQHTFETLLAYGEEYTTEPLLADAWEWSDDGLTLTLSLRDDVLFHNGDGLVASDVVASLERYRDAGSRDVLAAMVEDFVEVDDYTVDIALGRADSSLVPMLTSPLAYIAILPQEIIEGRERDDIQDVEDLVGTGPFEIVEWVADAELVMRRFDDYYQTEGERDGYAGAKVPYFDEIRFVPVPESGARVSGLLAGDYDFVLELPRPERDRLEAEADVSPVVGGPGTWYNLIFNHHEDAGLSANLSFRQAIQARLDAEHVGNLIVAGDEEFLDMNPSIYRRAQEQWWTDVAADLWNQNDPERAQELLEEAGYDGEEFIITYDPSSDVDAAVFTALTEQLEDIGVNVRGDATDAKSDRIDQTEGWHAVPWQFTVRFTPNDWDATLNCATARKFWCNDEMEAAFEELRATLDEDEQKPYSDEIQRTHHEYVMSLKFPDTFFLVGRRNEIQGFEQWYLERFWGVWRES